MPAIKSMRGKPYSELTTQSICDIELVCARCGYVYMLNATKMILDTHMSAAVKIKCPKCEMVFEFKVAYHNDPAAYVIYDGDSVLPNKWYEFFKGELI